MPLLKIKKMNTRSLHNSELKKLVRVLRDSPSSKPSNQEAYIKRVKELPGRLRSSALSRSNVNLCTVHKGLDSHLLTDIWVWARHEFGAIGRLLYPLLMEQKLTSAEENKLRQMEPVLEMWRTDFELAFSAPPDREPIDKGSKWKYQSNQCPACMLTRIGSDEDVLFALFTGMIGRFPMHKLTSRKVTPAEFGVGNLKNIKSKRVRLIRYWIQASGRGVSRLSEATNLGVKLKTLSKEWKEAQRNESTSLYLGRHSLDRSAQCSSMEESRPQTATGAEQLRDSTQARCFMTALEMTTTHACNDPVMPEIITADPKIGPEPRPKDFARHSPLESLGFNLAGDRKRLSTDSLRPLRASEPHGPLAFSHSLDSASTIYPGDIISIAPLRINKVKQPERAYSQVPKIPRPGPFDIPFNDYRRQVWHDSPLDDPQQLLAEPYSKPPSPPSPVWRPYASQARISVASTSSSTGTTKSYHASSSNDRASTITSDSHVETPLIPLPKNPFRDRSSQYQLPVPKQQSMYFGYETGDAGHDPFEDADEPLSENEEEGEDLEDPAPDDAGQISDASTHWSDLY